MNESNLWEWLRDVALPNGHYSRIESPDTAPGFPDVHFTLNGRSSGTLELKYARQVDPPFPADPDKGGLRTSQLKWIRDEIEQGGTVFIIAEVPKRDDWNKIYLIHGHYARKFNGASEAELEKMATCVMFREEPETAAGDLFHYLRRRAK